MTSRPSRERDRSGERPEEHPDLDEKNNRRDPDDYGENAKKDFKGFGG
jgi:hypothetical protein